MVEPWEALDVDDSDIPSLLRPCKRLHHENPISTTTTSPVPPTTLRPCSRHSSQNLVEQPPEPEPEPEPRRIIPGPAGAVQSAMLQKARDREKENFLGSQTSHLNVVSTQEYIRRAVEDAPEFDDDFSRIPWLSALEFIGTADGVVPSVPLSSFNQCVNVGKLDRVVAVIKSRTHSILGGLMVTLKDPTGTIGASVHHKLFSESQFSQDFAIGSVLILEKVATFSPSKSVHYLNIMPANLVKVFKKDNGPHAEHHIRTHSVKYVAPQEECLQKVKSPGKMYSPETDDHEDILDGMEHHIDRRGILEGDHQSQNEDVVRQSSTGSSRGNLKDNIVEQEPPIVTQDAEKGLFEETLQEKGGVDQHAPLSHDSDRRPEAANPKERLLSYGAVKRPMTQLVTSSLPLWTDQQLEELFAGDDEDDF